MFQKIAEAYEVLDNKEARRKYDQHGKMPQGLQPEPQQRSRTSKHGFGGQPNGGTNRHFTRSGGSGGNHQYFTRSGDSGGGSDGPNGFQFSGSDDLLKSLFGDRTPFEGFAGFGGSGTGFDTYPGGGSQGKSTRRKVKSRKRRQGNTSGRSQDSGSGDGDTEHTDPRPPSSRTRHTKAKTTRRESPTSTNSKPQSPTGAERRKMRLQRKQTQREPPTSTHSRPQSPTGAERRKI